MQGKQGRAIKIEKQINNKRISKEKKESNWRRRRKRRLEENGNEES